MTQRIPPLQLQDLPQTLRQRLETIEGDRLREYVPNGYLTMAYKPGLTEAVIDLTTIVMRDDGAISRDLRWMVAHVCSMAAGCKYCTTHTALNAAKRAGVSAQRIDALWGYATSPFFSDAERAALDLAVAAGTSPSMATDQHFDTLKAHFSSLQIIEIVAVIALYGWFNRWNDTLATELETLPAAQVKFVGRA